MAAEVLPCKGVVSTHPGRERRGRFRAFAHKNVKPSLPEAGPESDLLREREGGRIKCRAYHPGRLSYLRGFVMALDMILEPVIILRAFEVYVTSFVMYRRNCIGHGEALDSDSLNVRNTPTPINCLTLYLWRTRVASYCMPANFRNITNSLLPVALQRL